MDVIVREYENGCIRSASGLFRAGAHTAKRFRHIIHDAGREKKKASVPMQRQDLQDFRDKSRAGFYNISGRQMTTGSRARTEKHARNRRGKDMRHE